jgi:hypothetical protein
LTPFKKNVIVTGIPRGGTTLTAALLDNLTDFVCLSEPGWQAKWFFENKKADQLVRLIAKDFQSVRKKIIHSTPIIDKRNNDGSPVTNYFSTQRKGKRKDQKARLKRSIIFPIENPDFTLGMKHNAHYTGILPKLVKSDQFSIIAVIRHPVPTILSWMSLNLPISRGKLPAGEGVWAELKAITDSKEKLINKQARIYDLFCQRYLEFNNDIHLYKYEEIVEDPSLFEKLTGKTYEKKLELTNQNRSKIYDFRKEEKIIEAITRYAPHALKLYPL